MVPAFGGHNLDRPGADLPTRPITKRRRISSSSICADGKGGVHAILETRLKANIAYRHFDGKEWGTAERVLPAWKGVWDSRSINESTVCSSGMGVIVIWAEPRYVFFLSSAQRKLLMYSERRNGSWTKPKPIPGAGKLVKGDSYACATAPSGEVHLVVVLKTGALLDSEGRYSDDYPAPLVYFRYDPQRQAWSNGRKIAIVKGHLLSRPSIAAGPDGQVCIAWADRRFEDGYAVTEMFLRLRGEDGWKKTVALPLDPQGAWNAAVAYSEKLGFVAACAGEGRLLCWLTRELQRDNEPVAETRLSKEWNPNRAFRMVVSRDGTIHYLWGHYGNGRQDIAYASLRLVGKAQQPKAGREVSR